MRYEPVDRFWIELCHAASLRRRASNDILVPMTKAPFSRQQLAVIDCLKEENRVLGQ